MKKIGLGKGILLMLGLLVLTCGNAAEKRHLNIVFIGNSITQGVGLEKPSHEAPPVQAVLYLGKQPGVGEVRFSNQGVSGCTTVDYLPTTHTLFDRAKQAADQFADEDWATLVFSLMLGTNDSAIHGTNGAPVSPEQYTRNMITGGSRTKYMQEGLDRLISYYPEIQALVKAYAEKAPGRVFLGDTEGFDFFKENEAKFQHEQGNAGIFFLHPNKEGAKDLGELWGKAIYNVLGL